MTTFLTRLIALSSAACLLAIIPACDKSKPQSGDKATKTDKKADDDKKPADKADGDKKAAKSDGDKKAAKADGGKKPAAKADGDKKPADKADGEKPANGGGLGQACLDTGKKQVACLDDMVTASVDAMIASNTPPGIADKVKTPEGKAALVKAVKAQAKAASSEAAYSKMCEALTKSVPADKAGALTAEMNTCLAQSDCKAFATCSVALQVKIGKEATASAPKPPNSEEFNKVCLDTGAKQIACLDDMVSLGAEAMIKTDMPPGTAKNAKTPEGKAALIKALKAKAQAASSKEAQGQMCDGLSRMLPSDMQGAMLEGMKKCLQQKECKAFAACSTAMQMALQKKMMERAKAGAKTP